MLLELMLILQSGDPTFQPQSAAPSMSADLSPAIQDVVKGATSYQLTASVTDKDTYRRSTDNQLVELSGPDATANNVTDFNASAINHSFDSATGKRTNIYTFLGDWSSLLPSGQISYVFRRTQGRDFGVSLVIRDQDTSISTAIIALKYVPVAPGGGG